MPIVFIILEKDLFATNNKYLNILDAAGRQFPNQM